MRAFARFRPDDFTLAMAATLAVAVLLPCRGMAAPAFRGLTEVAIALLFFLQGARLSRAAVTAGALHWRFHLVVFAATFALFPVLGLVLGPLSPGVLAPPLYAGVLLLAALPSTVQSSVAFTSIAGGNVAAALCSASASSLVGIVLTPLLAGLLLRSGGGFSAGGVETIVLELLVPFLAGQALQRRIGSWVRNQRRVLGLVDRASILLMVYTVFSEATVDGLWRELPARELVVLAVVCAALLGAMLALTTLGARLLGFSRDDEIAIVFCGSKKSLMSGIPIASVLFAGPGLGLVLLPLMVFHQIQLMACAALARRYASGTTAAPAPRLRPA